MLNGIKTTLRISNTAYDTEILDLIKAAKLELNISGVNKIIDTDPLIIRATTLYVKANFGWDNPDSQRLLESFNSLRQHLALSGDYNVVE